MRQIKHTKKDLQIWPFIKQMKNQTDRLHFFFSCIESNKIRKWPAIFYHLVVFRLVKKIPSSSHLLGHWCVRCTNIWPRRRKSSKKANKIFSSARLWFEMSTPHPWRTHPQSKEVTKNVSFDHNYIQQRNSIQKTNSKGC